jgi:DNA-3-methyladenine glycosylase I
MGRAGSWRPPPVRVPGARRSTEAGLSWETILKKRQNYRAALDEFDPTKVARYGPKKKESLRNDAGIVRNRLKIELAIGNAGGVPGCEERVREF